MQLTTHTVVEITPIGISSLSWRFYIIWTIFNFAFLPIIYLFYPETAARTLEDIDRLFRENHDILIFKDKDAISPKRPQAYIDHEHTEIRRASSVDAAAMRKMSRVGAMMDMDRMALDRVEKDNDADNEVNEKTIEDKV